jgi:hypothetical protein
MDRRGITSLRGSDSDSTVRTIQTLHHYYITTCSCSMDSWKIQHSLMRGSENYVHSSHAPAAYHTLHHHYITIYGFTIIYNTFSNERQRWWLMTNARLIDRANCLPYYAVPHEANITSPLHHHVQLWYALYYGVALHKRRFSSIYHNWAHTTLYYSL